MPTSPHEVLGLPEDADPQAAKARYRELVKRYHPDVNEGDPTAEWVFKQIDEAYRKLPQNRKSAVATSSSNGARAPGSARSDQERRKQSWNQRKAQSDARRRHEEEEARYRKWVRDQLTEEEAQQRELRDENGSWWAGILTILASWAGAGVAYMNGQTAVMQLMMAGAVAGGAFRMVWWMLRDASERP